MEASYEKAYSCSTDHKANALDLFHRLSASRGAGVCQPTIVKPDITVVNKHHKAVGEYIGRGSPLGNMWTHLDSNFTDVIKVGSRTEAITAYKVWLDQKIADEDPIVCDELNRLAHIAMQDKPLRLVCYCKPQACHGDVIRAVLLKALKEL